jgi:hypothetical protein
MPKPPEHHDYVEVDPLVVRAEFEEPDAWRRSNKGNLWRVWNELTVTIFRHRDGGFAWCIVDAEGEKRFSKKSFEDEEWAMGALADAVGLTD